MASALPGGRRLAAITIVIYSVGWGPTLALGLLFGVADCMRTLGLPGRPSGHDLQRRSSSAWASWPSPPVSSPPSSPNPSSTDWPLLAALGIVFTIKLLEWVFAARERTERRFKALVQHAADMIVVADGQGRLTYVSPSFEEQLGYARPRRSAVLGGDLVHPDDLTHGGRRLRRRPQLDRGDPLSFELRIRAADQTWRWFDVTLTNLLDDPDVAGIVANLHDITDRKASEVALREAEERFRTSFDEAPIGMILVSRTGHVLQTNRAFCEIVGRSRSDVDRDVGAGAHPPRRPRGQPVVDEASAWPVRSTTTRSRSATSTPTVTRSGPRCTPASSGTPTATPSTPSARSRTSPSGGP